MVFTAKTLLLIDLNFKVTSKHQDFIFRFLDLEFKVLQIKMEIEHSLDLEHFKLSTDQVP